MILCDTKDWQREKLSLHPIISEALKWVENNDISKLEPGKYELLSDNKMFCLIQEVNTTKLEERRVESHFNYVDIQYLYAGEEKIGISRSDEENIIIESNPERDVIFYSKVKNESVITLTPGMFAVFFPHDIHRPCGQSGENNFIKKAVFKIHISLFS